MKTVIMKQEVRFDLQKDSAENLNARHWREWKAFNSILQASKNNLGHLSTQLWMLTKIILVYTPQIQNTSLIHTWWRKLTFKSSEFVCCS